MTARKSRRLPRRRTKKSPVLTKQTSSLVAQLVKQEATATAGKDAQPKISLPEPPPDSLDEVGVAEWERVTELLVSLNLLNDLDTTALLLYCDAYSDFRRAMKELAATKRDIIKTGKKNGGDFRNPWFDVKRRAAQDMNQYLALFGLSPLDRAKMKSHGKNPDRKPNDFDEF